MMTIGVDAGMLGINDERLKVGVWRVASNLLTHLGKLDNKNVYRLYSFHPIDPALLTQFGPHMTNVVLSPSVGYMKMRLPIELALHPVDIFLGLGQAIPNTVVRSIGFVYDLGFLFGPEAYGPSFGRLGDQTSSLMNRSSHIMTISESAKQECMRYFSKKNSEITVAYPGVGDHFHQKGTVHQHPRPYFLFVGSLNKAKDLPLLLASFAKVLHDTKKKIDLVLVGGDYWPDSRIDEVILRHNLKDRVIRTGHVHEDMLPGYYRGAIALMATGIHEGFCLPAIEAMACGTPVIAVHRGALGEIVGDGGLVAPADSHHIAEAMKRMMKKSFRMQLSKRAIVRSKQFSWTTFSHKILSLIETYAHQAR